MGSINSVPVVSQIKSLVQVISGDAEGAKKTQEEFARKGIVVSQVSWKLSLTAFRSSVHWIDSSLLSDQ